MHVKYEDQTGEEKSIDIAYDNSMTVGDFKTALFDAIGIEGVEREMYVLQSTGDRPIPGNDVNFAKAIGSYTYLELRLVF